MGNHPLPVTIESGGGRSTLNCELIDDYDFTDAMGLRGRIVLGRFIVGDIKITCVGSTWKVCGVNR